MSEPVTLINAFEVPAGDASHPALYRTVRT